MASIALVEKLTQVFTHGSLVDARLPMRKQRCQCKNVAWTNGVTWMLKSTVRNFSVVKPILAAPAVSVGSPAALEESMDLKSWMSQVPGFCLKLNSIVCMPRPHDCCRKYLEIAKKSRL